MEIRYWFHYKIEIDNGKIEHKRVWSDREESAVEKIYKLYPNWLSIELIGKHMHKYSKLGVD